MQCSFLPVLHFARLSWIYLKLPKNKPLPHVALTGFMRFKKLFLHQIGRADVTVTHFFHFDYELDYESMNVILIRIDPSARVPGEVTRSCLPCTASVWDLSM